VGLEKNFGTFPWEKPFKPKHEKMIKMGLAGLIVSENEQK